MISCIRLDWIEKQLLNRLFIIELFLAAVIGVNNARHTFR